MTSASLTMRDRATHDDEAPAAADVVLLDEATICDWEPVEEAAGWDETLADDDRHVSVVPCRMTS